MRILSLLMVQVVVVSLWACSTDKPGADDIDAGGRGDSTDMVLEDAAPDPSQDAEVMDTGDVGGDEDASAPPEDVDEPDADEGDEDVTPSDVGETDVGETDVEEGDADEGDVVAPPEDADEPDADEGDVVLPPEDADEPDADEPDADESDADEGDEDAALADVEEGDVEEGDVVTPPEDADEPDADELDADEGDEDAALADVGEDVDEPAPPRTPDPEDRSLGLAPSDAAYAGSGSVYTVDFDPDGTFSMAVFEDGESLFTASGGWERVFGFVRLVVEASQGEGAPAPGVETLAVEVPGYATFMIPPDLQHDGLIPMLVTGTCPSADLDLNWLRVGDSTSDAHDADTEMLGGFTLDVDSWTAAVSQRFSLELTPFELPTPPLMSQPCDPDAVSIEIREEGETVATMFLAERGALVQLAQDDGAILAVGGAPVALPELSGLYSGFIVRSRDLANAKQFDQSCNCGPDLCARNRLEGDWSASAEPVRVAFRPDGRVVGEVLEDVEAGTVRAGRGFSLELTQVNHPRPGFVTGTFSNAAGSEKVACAATAAVGEGDQQNLIVCAAQPPGQEVGAPAFEIVLSSLPGFTPSTLGPALEPVDVPDGVACGQDRVACFGCCEQAEGACREEAGGDTSAQLLCWPELNDCYDACVEAQLPEPVDDACVAVGSVSALGKVVFVEKDTGDDNNDGLSLEGAVATLERGAALLEPGDVMLVGPGVYFEQPEFTVIGTTEQAPVWIRARCPGQSTISGMWREAAEGTVLWEDEGDGVYSAPRDAAPLYGYYDDKLLFRHMAVEELTTHVVAINQQNIRNTYGRDSVVVPPYGISYVPGPVVNRRYPDGRVYVRLPGDADPNGRSVLISLASRNEWGNAPVVTVSQTPHLILDGFKIEGSGTFCVDVAADSPNLTIRNVVFSHCTNGVRMPDNGLVEWSEFSIPGLTRLLDRVRCLNEGDNTDPFILVKGHHGGSGAWMEGGIAVGRCIRAEGQECVGGFMEGDRSPTGAEFRYNFIHDNFDGEKLGSFEFSESHHNVYLRNFDNHVELEGGNALGTARELRLHDSLFLSCTAGPISHQSNIAVGPHYVYRNVVHGYDAVGFTTWTQIKAQAPNADIFYYHNLLWGGEGSLFPQGQPRDRLEFRNNIFVFDRNTNAATNVPLDADYNIVVNFQEPPNDQTFLAGPNGAVASQVEGLMFWDAATFNFGVMPGGVAEGAGVALPDLPGGDAEAGDIGPFPSGENPGSQWPRPRQTTFTTAPPQRWP